MIIMVKTSVQCMSVELCSRRSQICWGEIVCELEHGTMATGNGANSDGKHLGST